MTSPPPQFTGTLDEFYELHVVPNLPSPEIVEYYHRLLLDYCAMPDALFLVRYIRDTERRRIYTTDRGDRFVATDNAPAWWMHHTLFHEERISATDFPSTLASMPTHFHDVHARIPQSINTAGWHVAHIFQVKDGDTDYVRWGRNELVGRFIRNIHPCNYFFVAKADWQRFGGDDRFIAFFVEIYADRYRAVWSDFLGLARADATRSARVFGPISYQYDSSLNERSSGAGLTSAKSSTPSPSGSSTIAPSYRAKRLLFKAAVIEALSPAQRFQVITPRGTFEMSKDDFYRVFPNVVRSRSYREAGIYHYPTLPRAVQQFLVSDALLHDSPE